MDGGEGELGPLLGSDMTYLLILSEEGILTFHCCDQASGFSFVIGVGAFFSLSGVYDWK